MSRYLSAISLSVNMMIFTETFIDTNEKCVSFLTMFITAYLVDFLFLLILQATADFSFAFK